MSTLLLAYANNEKDHLNTLRRESKEVGDAFRSRQAKKDFVVLSESMATRAFIIDTIRSHEADLCLFLFSGHAGRDNLLFEDGSANAEGIAGLLGRCKKLELVILNGCSTAGQVKALLRQGVPAVVATSAPVGDEKATHFSVSFFRELAEHNRSIKEAFERAIDSTKVMGQLEEAEITRGLSTEENSSAVWGLFYQDEASLNWSLPEAQNEKEQKPLTWAVVSGVVFLAFLATTFLFIRYYKELTLVSPSMYYFLVLIAAIIPTGFLFGALRSTARYSGKVVGGKLELGGAAALYFCLVLIGMANKPRDQPFSYTVNVFSEQDSTEVVEAGQVKILYGQASQARQISEGQSTFKEVPSEYGGKPLMLLANAEGYYPKKQTITITSDDLATTVYLKKIPDEVTMSGSVINRKGQPVRNATLFFGNEKAKATSDSLGMYSITLPYPDGTETVVSIYVGTRLQFQGNTTLSGKANKDFLLQKW